MTKCCLRVSISEDLVRISLQGSSVEESDPSSAVDRWLTLRRARQWAYKSDWTTDLFAYLAAMASVRLWLLTKSSTFFSALWNSCVPFAPVGKVQVGENVVNLIVYRECLDHIKYIFILVIYMLPSFAWVRGGIGTSLMKAVPKNYRQQDAW